MAAQPPNEVLEIFEREQSTLAALGAARGFLPVGSTLPDVNLMARTGCRPPSARRRATVPLLWFSIAGPGALTAI